MLNILREIFLLWIILILSVPCMGQDFNKQLPNRMTSAGSGFGTGETVDMRVLIGQPVPGIVGNGQSFQVRTNSEDMLTRRLNYTLVANAGLDQSTVEGDNVTLDASLSYDPANTIVKYQWIQLSGPEVELDDSLSLKPQFIAPEVSIFGAYLVFQLTVFNSNNVSAQDTVKIFVKNEIKNFIITVSASAGGNISPNEDVYLREGDSIRFSFLASTGYYLSDVFIDGISVGPKDTYDFVDIIDNHSIHADFTARPKIQVRVNIDGDGSVSPEGPINVNAGDNVQLTFSPGANHHVANVEVNGLSKGPMNDLLLKNLNDNVIVTVNFMLGDFHIQASCDENGSITPNGWISTYLNDNQSFEIAPDPGYIIDKVQVNGAYIDPVTHFTFWNISDYHRIHVTFRPKMVIMAASSDNGAIVPSGMIKVETGSFKTFEMVPDEGYRVSDVLIDGISHGPIKKHTFFDIQSGHTIEVIFVRDIFTIEATSGPYGSILPEGNIAVEPGNFQFFEFNPDHGFRVASVAVDAENIGAVNQYYFEDIDQNHTINVQFEPARIIVQAVSGNNGNIYPSGAVVVAEGGSQEFQIQPDMGYTIQNVKVDNKNLGKLKTFVFEDLSASHTIEAVFEPMLTIQATALENGSLSPTGQIYVPKHNDQSIVITPDEGYVIDKLVIDGSPVAPKNIHVFWDVTQSHTLLASFRRFQLTATADENGSITPNGQMQVNKGHDQTFDILPNDGYTIEDVVVDHVSQGAIDRYTFWDIQADHDIYVTFVMRPRHTVVATASEGGMITPSGELALLEGDYPEFLIIPLSGYKIADVQVNNESIGAVTNYIFSNLQADATIHVSFEALPRYTIHATSNAGGTISPNGAMTVVAGEFISFEITPAPEYIIESVVVDHLDFGPVRSYPMLADGDHQITAQFAKRETRTISGHIFDLEQPDLPLSGFQIKVWQKDRLQGTAISDDNGFYEVSGLPVASDLIVSAWPPLNDSNYQGLYYINQQRMQNANRLIVLADNLAGIDLFMPKAPVEGFSGQVHDRMDGIGNIEVHASSRDNTHSVSAITDAQGNYQIVGLYPDRVYRISAYSDNFEKDFFFALTDNQTPGIDAPTSSTISANLANWLQPTTPILKHIDIIFDPDSGESISGNVSINGKPVADMTVHAWSSSLRVGSTAITDHSGNYFLKGLSPVSQMDAPTAGYLVEIISDDYVYQSISSVATHTTDVNFQLVNQISINGHITDENGAPLSNVLIQAVSSNDPWHKSAIATSDHSGNYTLIVTPAPDYVINASKSTYFVQYYNQADSPEHATAVNACTLTDTQIDFQLNSGAFIQGDIFVGTENTKAPEGVWVTIRSDSTSFVGQCQTNALGHYIMRGLDDAVSDYQIMARFNDNMPVYYSDNGDTDMNNDSVYNRKYAGSVQPSETNRNLILLSGYRIRGRILDNNAPVYGITVEAFSEITGGWGRMLTQDLGAYQYEISGLPPGIYTVNVSGKDYQTITKSVTLVRQTTYLDFVLHPPNSKISGVIYGLDRGDILWIKAMSSNLGVERSHKLEGTDAALSFVIDQLPSASDYILYVYGNDYPQTYYPDQPGLETAQTIDLQEGNADNIVFHLTEKASRTISGYVRFYSSFPDGETVRITARSESGHHEKTISFVYNNDMIKQYQIEGLIPANDYLILISANACIDQYYPDALTIEKAKTVSTMSGNAEGINFELSAGSTMQGQITGMTGHDIHIFATAINLDVQAETIPASDGTFMIDGLAHTDYILSAHIQDVGVFYYHPYKTVRDISESIPLSVTDDNISSITFAISDLQTISGSITSEKGNALANVFVTCHSESLNFGDSTYSDASGQYELAGLLQATDYIVTAAGINTDDDFHTSLSHQNVSAGETAVNFVLQAQDAYDIKGQIVDSMNQPLKQVVVEIQASDNSNQYDRARTNSEGFFTLQGIPQGSNYILWVWPKTDMPLAYYRATQISIPNPNFFQIILKTASNFGGKIVDDYSKDPISNAEITVFSEQTGFFQTTQSDSTGVYTITNAPLARDYRIVLQHQSYLDQEYSDQSPHAQLNFEMPASGCIYGELKSSETGSSVSDATVSVFSIAYDSAPDYIGTTQSNINGQFEVCNLRMRDSNGHQVNDYQLDVSAIGYPIQTRGGLRVGTGVNLLMESNPQYELSGKIDNTLDLNFILKIFDKNSQFIQSTRIKNNEFHISGLNPESGYRINVKAWESGDEPVIDAWVAASGRLVDNESNGKLFVTGADVNIILSGSVRKKRSVTSYKKGPGPVRDLRCLTHPYVTVNNRLRAMASAIPAEVNNRPNVAMTWDPPEGDDVEGYYYSFNKASAHTLNEFNTVDKPPVRTRKITSRDLEGDDVSYYFHVAAIDKAGRVGDTVSIAFRIDTQAPTNINVFLPSGTLTRDVNLSLGASGAAEMYISNVSFSSGGIWERLRTKKQWQLSGESGSKKVFVGFRDRAKNMSETFGHTILNVGANEHTITIKANAYGNVTPTQIVVNDKDSPVIKITPNAGYQVSRMTLDDRAIQYAGMGYIFSPVTDDHILSVTFKPIEHMVYISSSDNGIVIPAGPVAVEHDHSLSLEFEADSGFALSHITVEGTPHEITGQTYQLEHIQSDVHLTAHFNPAHTISATAGSNGNVEPKAASVFNGKAQTFTFEPSSGYGVSKLWIDDIATPIQGNRYTFYNVDGNHTLYVQFETAQYEIVSLSGANGQISPKGTISVPGMSKKVFQMTPDDGYMIDQVLVDDTPVTISDNSYTLEDIDANHKIFVTFRRLNYPPQVNSGTETLNEDQRFDGKLIATDPNEKDILTFAISQQPIHGSINLNTQTGDYVYQPASNYNGTDSFQYMANDGLVSSEAATIDFNILAVNDAPKAHSDTLSAKEDVATLYTLTATDVDNDSITYEILNLPEKGQITLTNAEKGYCVFRPFDNVVGRDEFTFKATDGHLDSSVATIQIIINNENDPPVIQSQNLTIDEDTPYTIVLSVNDPENDPLFFQMVFTGQNGNATIIDPIKGTVIYTPKPNVSGDDFFVYSVTDNQSEAQSATVTVSIAPVNDPPVALQQQIDIFANASMTITLTAYDIDSPKEGFTYELIDTPIHGYATGNPPSITYQPNNNYIGLDQLTFAVHDNEGKSDTGIIKFNVLSPPDAIGTEDHELPIDLPVYVVIDPSTTQYGELTGTPPNLIYRPDENFFGKDTFTYTINDQKKTYVVYISPVNDAPVIEIEKPTPPLQTNEDIPLVIDINAFDNDNDELQVKWEQPAHGSVTGNASQIVYSPYPSYSGRDSFWVDAFDGYVTTRLTIDILVGKVNNAPIATDRTLEGLEDQFIEILLQAMDPDNDAISYTIATFPTHGSLSGTPPSVIYQPAENYHGQDAFGFTASDGVLTSNIGQIQINILPQNDAPIALNSLLDAVEDTPVFSSFLANDIDQDALTFMIIQTGQLGETILTNSSTGEFTYTPFTNVYGVDSVQFQVMDAQSQSNVGQVSITIAPVNDSPTAQPAVFETEEDIPFDATLIAQDIDSDQLAFKIVDSPQLGHIAIISTGHFSYTPFENVSGQDQFTFKVQDAHGGQSTRTQVTIDIHAVNDAPIAQSFSIQMDEDTSFTGLLHGVDVDSSSLSYSIVTLPQKGTVNLLNQETGKFVYIPHANVSGDDNFTYHLSDGIQRSEFATVSVWITPVNDSPILESQNVEIEQDQEAHITLMAEDADHDSLSYKIITIPDHGTASIDGAGVNYMPLTGFLGVDTLTVNAFDGKVDSKTATIQIWVGIHQVDVILTEDEPIRITLPEQVSVVQMPDKGMITQDEGHYAYHPNENEFGYDSFYYKSTPDASSVSMTLFIKPVNDPPSITVQDSFTITEDQDYQFQIEIFDPETSSDQLITSVTDAPDHGKIQWIDDFIQYQPFSDYNGADAFTIRVSDGFENSFVSKTIQVTILPSNDIPRPIAQSVTMFEDQSKDIQLRATDLENDPIIFAIYEKTNHGTITGTPPDMIYTPVKDFFGKDYLFFTASDSEGTSQPQPITIVVLGTQDRPVAHDSSLEVPQDVVQISGQLFASDPDNDVLIYSIVTQPGKGRANLTSPTRGTFVYTPNPGMSGEDLLTFHVSDNYETSNLGLVTIQIADSTLLYHQLNLTIIGDYLDGDTYGYSIVNTQSNVVVKQDQVNTSQISLYLPENEYAFHFSGAQYQSLSHTFELLADMTIPIIVQNNPDVFRFTINLKGDYIDNEPVTVRILNANTNKVLQTISTSSSQISTRWIAGIYKYSVQGNKYESYQSPAVYLDKDKIVEAALIRQSDTQLTINLTGDYQNGDPYAYKVINAANGLIVRQGQNNIQTLPVFLGQGNYRIFIIADNYDPLECAYNDQKLIHFVPDMQIQASLTQSSFTQKAPFVGISYQRTDEGLDMQFDPENFIDGMTVTLNNVTIASHTNQPLSYEWKKSNPGMTPTVIDGDSYYELYFEFFDGNSNVHDYPVTYIDYESEASEINDRSDDQKSLEAQYGDAGTIANAHKTFYPLIGTRLDIQIKDTMGEEQPLTIEIPPIPLDYLFIDNSTSDTPGQMMYRTSDDTYRILSDSTDKDLHPTPGQKLSVIIHHYYFAQSAGSGAMVSFEMAEGKYAGARVRYNPMFRDGRLSENNNESSPEIKVPLLLNKESPHYEELNNYLTGTDARSFLIGERGDGISGLKQAEFQFEKINNVVYIKMTHLTIVGFDIVKDVTPEPEPEISQGGDSGGGCFIDACLSGAR